MSTSQPQRHGDALPQDGQSPMDSQREQPPPSASESQASSGSSWEVRLGDCRSLMAEMVAGSVDAIVTDPPYGERNASWDGPKSQTWHEGWLREADRVLKPGAPLVAFFSRRYLDILMSAVRSVLGDTPQRPLQSGVWVHRQGFSVNSGFLRPEHEPFIVSGRLRVDADDVRRARSYQTDYNLDRKPTRRGPGTRGFAPLTYVPHEIGPMAGSVFECARNKPAEATGHPTQKPESVMEYLVLMAAEPGGTVLDPFAGSGTTGVACLRHGRRFIGIEQSEEYVRIARNRIGGPLFAA